MLGPINVKLLKIQSTGAEIKDVKLPFVYEYTAETGMLKCLHLLCHLKFLFRV